MCREAADKAEQRERARTFRQRGLRNVGSEGSWASVVLGRHGSMVSSRVLLRMTPAVSTPNSVERGLHPLGIYLNHSGLVSRPKGGPMEVDRRAFFASLGGVAAVTAMDSEAKADALEAYLSDQLDEAVSAPPKGTGSPEERISYRSRTGRADHNSELPSRRRQSLRRRPQLLASSNQCRPTPRWRISSGCGSPPPPITSCKAPRAP